MAKILYVEDNEMNRDMLSRRLERKEGSLLPQFDFDDGRRTHRRLRQS